MKTLRYLSAALTFIALTGCNVSENFPDNGNEPPQNEMTVVQERDPAYPLTDYSKLKEETQDSRVVSGIPLDEFVGRSYKLKIYPFEHPSNVGLPVIDMKRYVEDNPDYAQAIPIKESNTTYQSFSGFERYEQKMQKTKNINTGLQLDFKIFKIGAQAKYKEIFSVSTTDIRQDVFGELGIKYYDTKYEMMVTDYIKKEIRNNYLKSTFLKSLYYNSTEDFIKNYGGFVLTKFLSGGQATALYHGKYLESIHDVNSVKETELNKEINASLNVS